jgi:hypothetical protein
LGGVRAFGGYGLALIHYSRRNFTGKTRIVFFNLKQVAATWKYRDEINVF